MAKLAQGIEHCNAMIESNAKSNRESPKEYKYPTPKPQKSPSPKPTEPETPKPAKPESPIPAPIAVACSHTELDKGMHRLDTEMKNLQSKFDKLEKSSKETKEMPKRTKSGCSVETVSKMISEAIEKAMYYFK